MKRLQKNGLNDLSAKLSSVNPSLSGIVLLGIISVISLARFTDIALASAMIPSFINYKSGSLTFSCRSSFQSQCTN